MLLSSFRHKRPPATLLYREIRSLQSNTQYLGTRRVFEIGPEQFMCSGQGNGNCDCISGLNEVRTASASYMTIKYPRRDNPNYVLHPSKVLKLVENNANSFMIAIFVSSGAQQTSMAFRCSLTKSSFVNPHATRSK